MIKGLVLDLRKLKEIKLNIYYLKFLAHGTDSHNLRMLNAELAMSIGFDLNEQGDLTFRDRLIAFGEGATVTLSDL